MDADVMQIQHIFINLISTLDEDRIQNTDLDMILSSNCAKK